MNLKELIAANSEQQIRFIQEVTDYETFSNGKGVERVVKVGQQEVVQSGLYLFHVLYKQIQNSESELSP